MIIDELNKLDKRLAGFNEDSQQNFEIFEKEFAALYDGYRRTPVTPYYTSDLNLWRARKSESKVYHTLSELWYPPMFDLKRGRFNKLNQQMFYCSTDLSTALAEINPLPNELITVLNVSITKPELQLVQLEQRFLNNQNYWDGCREGDKELFEYIYKKSREIINERELWHYYPLNIYAYGMKNNGHDGICYNSTRNNLEGFNFALYSESIDNCYKFISATIMDIPKYTDSNSFVARCLWKATKLDNIGRFIYSKILCDGHAININTNIQSQH